MLRQELFGELLDTPHKRRVLLTLSLGYLLVQSGFIPIVVTLPSVSRDFDAQVGDVVWVEAIYLLALASLTMLAARLGDRYGRALMVLAGAAVTGVGAGLAPLSGELYQLVLFRAIQGIGAAFILGNGLSFVASVFGQTQRGRASAFLLMGAQIGGLAGLVVAGTLLQFSDWRIVYWTYLALAVVTASAAAKLLRRHGVARGVDRRPVDWLGALLLMLAMASLVLGSFHVHGGEESYSAGVEYHLSMHVAFIMLLASFILVELRVPFPLVPLRLFRQKYFSAGIAAHGAGHLTMMAIMVLLPFLVERGLGLLPLYVTALLVPYQVVGLIFPYIGGRLYDRYRPRWLRPLGLALVAASLVLQIIFVGHGPFWVLVLLLLPASVGTGLFGAANSAAVLNATPSDNYGFASGMLETTRHFAHTIGTIVALGLITLVVPEHGAPLDLQADYLTGFRLAAMCVFAVALGGAALAFVHQPQRERANQPLLAASA